MNNKTKETDLVQFALYLWNRIVVVLIVAILGIAIVAGYNLKKQKSVTPVAQSRAVISSIVTQNRTAFFAPANQPQPYTYDNVPSGACYSNAKLFIDYNYNIFENSNILDTADTSKKLQTDIYLLLVSNTSLQDVINELDLASYEDMAGITPDTLRWMISSTFNSSNIVEVFVTDSNPERAQKIAEAIINNFVVNSESIDLIDGVKIVDNPSRPIGGVDISTGYVPINKKAILKYGLIGFVIGLFIIVCYYLMLFIINDPIMNTERLVDSDVKVLGTISCKQTKREKDVKRIANNIALSFNSEKIIFIPVDKKTESFDYISDVSGALKEQHKTIDFSCVHPIIEDPDVILKLKDSEGIVLGVTYSVTRMNDLLFSIKEIEKTGKEFLGVIINNV